MKVIRKTEILKNKIQKRPSTLTVNTLYYKAVVLKGFQVMDPQMDLAADPRFCSRDLHENKNKKHVCCLKIAWITFVTKCCELVDWLFSNGWKINQGLGVSNVLHFAWDPLEPLKNHLWVSGPHFENRSMWVALRFIVHLISRPSAIAHDSNILKLYYASLFSAKYIYIFSSLYGDLPSFLWDI